MVNYWFIIGECSEGSVWESFAFASFYKLDNLCAIIDVNRLGQSDPAPLQHDMETYRKRVDAFGYENWMVMFNEMKRIIVFRWHPIVVNGQDVNQLLAAFKEASETKNKPTCIIAKTFKGAGLKGIENELDWHGKPLGNKAAELVANLRTLVNEGTLVRPAIPKVTAKVPEIKKDGAIKLSSPPNYDKTKEVWINNDRIFSQVYFFSRLLHV